MQEEYKISELAEKAGVTKRTIHYYISKGLIPPPEGAGVGSIYCEEHYVKVLLVKKLQEKYLPLDKIREIISELDIGQVKKLLWEGLEADYKMSSDVIKAGTVDNEPYGYKQKPDNNMENTLINLQESNRKRFGREYLRLSLGPGIELHCSSESYEKYGDLIDAIDKYARKLLEGK